MLRKDRVDFLGCPLDLTPPSTIMERAHRAMLGDGRLRIEGLNVAKLVQARSDTLLMGALCDAELVHVDGAGISLGLKAMGMPTPERRAGIDLMVDLCRQAAAMGQSVYLLGARPDIVQAAAKNLQVAVPDLAIAGTRDGYFNEADEEEIVETIRASGAGLLFIGISSPKKELFLRSHWERLDVSLGMGVGGSFDVISGSLRRAPLWMQQNGLEWLYRWWQEPVRLFGRYASTNLIFLWLLARARLTGRSGAMPGTSRHER